MVQVAALIAIEIVLSRFCSIATPIVKIGFGFVPIAVCGMLYGPVWAGVAGGAADLLGAVLFPIGAYFPGFTLSAVQVSGEALSSKTAMTRAGTNTRRLALVGTSSGPGRFTYQTAPRKTRRPKRAAPQRRRKCRLSRAVRGCAGL